MLCMYALYPRVPWNLRPHVMAHQGKNNFYSQECTWKRDSGTIDYHICVCTHKGHCPRVRRPCTEVQAPRKPGLHKLYSLVVLQDEHWNATLLNVHTSLQLKSYGTKQRGPALSLRSVWRYNACSIANVVYLHERSKVTSWVADWDRRNANESMQMHSFDRNGWRICSPLTTKSQAFKCWGNACYPSSLSCHFARISTWTTV